MSISDPKTKSEWIRYFTMRDLPFEQAETFIYKHGFKITKDEYEKDECALIYSMNRAWDGSARNEIVIEWPEEE